MLTVFNEPSKKILSVKSGAVPLRVVKLFLALSDAIERSLRNGLHHFGIAVPRTLLLLVGVEHMCVSTVCAITWVSGTPIKSK